MAATPALDTRSNDYVGPYGLTINGQRTPAMCMNDYNNVAGTWNANATPVNSQDLSNTYLGNRSYTVAGHSYSSAQVYAGEAYLFTELIAPGADRIDLQDAAWTIMDYVTGHTPHATGAAIDSIIADVISHSGSFKTAGYEILSQANPGANPEQEFIVATPEPSTLMLLGAALSVVGIVRFGRRRSGNPGKIC